MLKDTPQGQTCYCTHTVDGSLCNECLGISPHEEEDPQNQNLAGALTETEKPWWHDKQYWMKGTVPKDLLTETLLEIVEEATRRALASREKGKVVIEQETLKAAEAALAAAYLQMGGLFYKNALKNVREAIRAASTNKE